MKGIVALCLVALLAGCSAKQVRPEVSGSTIYRTPIEGATAQLVLPQDFQRKVVTQKPSFGKAWSIFDFEVHVGEPLSKAIASDIRARIPTARIGDTSDGKPASIRISTTSVALEFGVDDEKATGFWRSGIVGLATDVIPAAKVTVRASLSIEGGPEKQVDVTGLGAIPMAYAYLEQSDITKAIGLAIDDAANKLGAMAEADYRNK
ncbi:hypothetical protein LS633_11795 [Pseudomonas sp. NIBR-H-19]|uniref:hypothetical protein n=1 Tax=Pseudomonas sp. NIBR-H-19 TaxID=2901380 RepID=UPI001E56C4E3|nr:hypothetical protein [Pseudomonas sp. NIBR-H-19]UHC84445.1 hypothetical protein LS633_11795 [Pseudomonas sp. NIBR-H-19]